MFITFKQEEELLYSVGNTWVDLGKIIPKVIAEFKKSLGKHPGDFP